MVKNAIKSGKLGNRTVKFNEIISLQIDILAIFLISIENHLIKLILYFGYV